MQRLLGFGRADEADRHADDRRRRSARPRRAFPASRNNAVGALPMATIAPSSLGSQSSSAAAERVVPRRAASAGTAASPSVQITSLPAGSRARVTPSATIRASQRIGAPRLQRGDRRQRRALRKMDVGGRLDHAAGMDDAHRDALFRARKAREIGLAPDDREGIAINLRAVADIVAACRHLESLPDIPASAETRSLPTESDSRDGFVRSLAVHDEIVARFRARPV